MTPIPIRILLVEDNPDDSELIQIHLDEIDFFSVAVECFPRLAGALQRLDEATFDIAMLDLSLPDSHGIETVERVRKHAPYLPIIIMTGLNDQHVAYEAARTGAQDYLVKGHVDADGLGRCLRYAMERARAEAELRQHRDHLEELVEARSAELREKSERLQLLATAIEYAAEAMFITDADLAIR